jgi:transcriptional regulator CtsR
MGLAASAPAAPSNLNAEAVSGSEIKLTWTDKSDNETGFIVERGVSEGGPYSELPAVGANVTELVDTGLNPDTTYYYRVRAYQAGTPNIYSEYSAVASATTFPFPPFPPENLVAAAVTDAQINLSWTDKSNNEKGFKIERKTSTTDFQEIAAVGGDITAYADTGLESGITYTYRIRAYNDGGHSAYSNETKATTGGKPSAPTNLKAVAASSSQINLTWVDTSDNEKGFKIERKAAGGSWKEIAADIGKNVVSYSDKGLSAGTYTYRIKAYNDAGDSDYSAEASAEIGVAPAAPSNLTAKIVSKSIIELSWTDKADNEEGFKIERKVKGGSYSQIGTVGRNVTKYTSTGLSANKTYYFRVRAYNASGNSSFSNEVSVTTSAPSAPSNLKAERRSNTVIDLEWNDNSDNETGFKIERKKEGGKYAQIDTVGGDVTTYTDSGLSSNTTYFYRVRAYNSIGDSSYCTEVSVATTSLGSPSNLVAETASNSRINLSWEDNATNETGFKIERRTAGSSYKQIDTVRRNVTSYSDTGLSNNTTYYYRVRAYNSAGNSAYSNEASATTGTVPSAPSNLTVTPETASKARLNWKDNASNETGFKIERRTAGGSYKQIDTVGRNVTSYSDTGLSANTTYYYRVRAYNTVGNSSYSNEAVIARGALSAPTKLKARAVSGNKITLTWADNNDNETGFKIERRTAGGSYKQIATVGADITEYSDTGLSPGTTYYYRVRAYNFTGNSAYSSAADATTTAEAEKVIILNIGRASYYVNNQRLEMDVAPMIIEGRTVLPIRYLAEVIGAEVGWNQYEKKATITFKGKDIELWIGKSTARVDGEPKLIDPQNIKVVPVVIPPGRTMLPLRFISENLGCKVDWNANSQEVKVTYPAP